MRERQMLRSGVTADVARGPVGRREDERQGALDFDAPDEALYKRIERLAFENAQLRLRLEQAGTESSESQSVIYRAYNPVHGWIEKIDAIAVQAASFAKQLAGVTSLRTTGEADESDAKTVNEHIAMVAEQADALITALIKDAEARDLEATGPWMDIRLIECREFELARREDEIG